MASGSHIGFKQCTNNFRNEFPITKLANIYPLHIFASPPGGNFSIICELCLPDWWGRTQPEAVIELIYLPRVDLFYIWYRVMITKI